MRNIPRVRAPELHGRAWLNTGGRHLSLADFRGRFLLLDFWTSCCVNCLHVLDEMRPLEERYADALVVVGVHSPKFEHEADPAALAAAVERYEVAHPVLDDPDLLTWQHYTARAWPTLVLVDPEGYVVAQYAGEGHVHAIGALLAELVPEHEQSGTLQPGPGPYVPPVPAPSSLRFPANAARLAEGGFLVADAGHHQVVELAADGETVLRRFGSGRRGLTDGAADSAGFSEPNGVALLPDDVAAEVGYDVVVADTANHALRGIALTTGEVRTLAGNGRQWMLGDGVGALSSPWDVVWWQDEVWVAMAGVHQLWTYDPRTGELAVAAGTTNEGLVDGAPEEAWFAQPSGLAVDGDVLWLADAETSALRRIHRGRVETVIGTGLFDFGFRDGTAGQALLQHPLAVAALPDGSVAVADTYNGAVRRYDPRDDSLSTVATGLQEPAGLVVDDGHLVVVESAAHRLTRVSVAAVATASGAGRRTHRPPTRLAPGEVEVVVVFEPPPGQQLDDRYGAATRLLLEATPPGLLRSGGGPGTKLDRVVTLDASAGDGVLHVAARAASCDAESSTSAACYMHQQDWGVPVVLAEDGATRLVLTLGGASPA
jgi:thiol-disulfide isomerase/thioredoxin